MTTIEVIKMLCEREGISIAALEKEMGYGNGSLAKAKKIPADRIQELSKRFGCTMEYLMSGEEPEDTPGYYLNPETAAIAQEMYEDPDMRSLFDMKRNMPPERFAAHMKFMKDLYESEKKHND